MGSIAAAVALANAVHEGISCHIRSFLLHKMGMYDISEIYICNTFPIILGSFFPLFLEADFSLMCESLLFVPNILFIKHCNIAWDLSQTESFKFLSNFNRRVPYS